ncbi:MAG: homoserine dehydrogenase [Desulfosarcinaceae bacterium]|nr:homoserine dehydrogenase [Desulfosarcinaceae bacterium]
MKQIQIAILGYGTVGTGVARLLMENGELLANRVGAKLRLKYVADIDTTTDRGLKLPEGVLIDDAAKAVADPDIQIVVETIGGEGIAKALIADALGAGKHVVTANKALLAKYGNDLIATAAGAGSDLAFEASVGGCMPIIKTLREALVGNHVNAMTGILNGTCNYIFTKIADEGIPFEEALAQAQAGGYAEADPTLDVDGFDTAHKLAILGALAYGMEINFDDIFIEGIRAVTPRDITYASQFGYVIKLLAISKNHGDRIEARVHPTMIPTGTTLAHVNGTLNAISVSTDASGDILLSGHGAGMLPTASAVVGDVVDLARNLLLGVTGRIPVLSYQTDTIRKLPVMPMDDIVTHYYFRFNAMDQPGVLSKISGILGDHEISLKSVHQKGRKSNGSVPLVMLTHRAREAAVNAALQKIAALDIVAGTPMLIRIEDQQGDQD